MRGTHRTVACVVGIQTQGKGKGESAGEQQCRAMTKGREHLHGRYCFSISYAQILSVKIVIG